MRACCAIGSPDLGVMLGTVRVEDGGVLPVTPFAAWCFEPERKSGAGDDLAGWVLSLRARGSDSVLPAPSPGSLVLLVYEGKRGGGGREEERHEDGGRPGDGVPPVHGGDGWEVSDEVTQVVEYAAAIDVAKGFGMVCARVPGARPAGGGRRCGGWRPPLRRWPR